MPQAFVLLLVPCLRPSVQRVAKTSGRKRAGRRDDRGGHTRWRAVAAPRTVRIALWTASSRTAAGGVAASASRRIRPTAPTTSGPAAGSANTGGLAATISYHTPPTAPTPTSPAAGCANTGGGSTTGSHHTRPTTATPTSPAAGCANTGGGSTTIRTQTCLTTATPTSPAAGCANTGGGSTTIRTQTRPTTATPTNPVAGRSTGRTTGRGRDLSSPVPHALGSATDCASAAATAGRRLGSGGHSRA